MKPIYESELITKMRVRKRDGKLEYVDVNKIVNAVSRCAVGLKEVDPMRVSIRSISGLYDGATTRELDELSIRTAASLIFEEPEYSLLAARLLAAYIHEEVSMQGIQKFSDSIEKGFAFGLINERTYKFVKANATVLDKAINNEFNHLFEFFGLRTIYDRYLLRNSETREVIEEPQYFWMRVATGLSETVEEALAFYRLFASLEYIPSTPTLFNSGTRFEQLSSCFLLDSPDDSLEGIYDTYKRIALLSKYSGGIGLSYSRVRSQGSLIRGTNGLSKGIVPWLKTLDSSVAAVDQGGRRKGACCVYLETWHADIEDFLELRDNTGDEARRTYNLNIANWVPDIFMRRVLDDSIWSLFDPKDVPHFVDLYGEEFEKAYLEAEQAGLYKKQVRARELYARMIRTLAETGNGWMNFKDHANRKSNQTGVKGNVIHSSNLCTEILEVTNSEEVAVCNLGSVNLSKHVTEKGFDFEKLRKTVKLAVKILDRVIDLNFYAIDEARRSNMKWRNIGLGVMGLQDVFFKLRLPFDSEDAKKLSTQIAEEIYFTALDTSSDLAAKLGPHASFEETRIAREGKFQFDLWGVKPSNPERWKSLREKIKNTGLRNSQLIAIAPTATIASIAGCYESIEPQVSCVQRRETLSGDFLQVNKYLVEDLKKLGLWNDSIRQKIKQMDGSIQEIDEIPDDIKSLYKTAWELKMKVLIDMAAERAPFIDQSQSLNLFQKTPDIGKLSSMYMYAWQRGLKTTYYLRSRPATRIGQVAATKTFICSLENPESCEACQ
ncbi:MAG: ribonucleoside-diphosphate reductase subunit alpha [Pyrinomonadaceae bacterium]|nr:ribonucleoside-diphosphate reductase subunit alpha [Pyrinomonadaceae bacterium]